MRKSRRHRKGSFRPAQLVTDEVLRAYVPESELRLWRIRLAWPELMPPQVVRVTWPHALHQECLTIAVRDHQWLHELSYLRHELDERLQAGCPGEGVTALRFKVAEVPAVEARPSGRSPDEFVIPDIPSLPAEPSPETRLALSTIEDPALRFAMATARQALSRRGL